MTRYIDAEAIVYDFGEIDNGAQKRFDLFVTNEVIAEQPTIDAIPVKHGKWIQADRQQYFRKHYPASQCSICGWRKNYSGKYNYCPNCGADMRKSE
jgi:hypothetical protein